MSKQVSIPEEQLTRMVIFSLGEEYYGIDAASVQEIKRMETITPIPRTTKFILGVINLRSQVVPVMCLRRRFGLPVIEHTKSSRIIVVEHGETKFGILVDSVHEVAKLSNNDIDQAPAAVAGKGEFISGVYRHNDLITVILDAATLIPGKEAGNEIQG